MFLGGRLNDTFYSCHYSSVKAINYVNGDAEPHYPVPAIVVRVGYMPSGVEICEGRPYIYVASLKYLWTFWKDWGLVEERVC